jgi:hypothetical protein
MVMYMYRMGIDFASVYTTFLLDFRTVVTMWLLFFILFHHFCRYGITTRVRGAHLFSFCVVFFVFFVFVLCLVYSKLPISLDCPLLIALSVFSNVQFLYWYNNHQANLFIFFLLPEYFLHVSVV